jgi:tRNA pseudouridine38-40 synthase
VFGIEGSGFLWNMIRIIVGTLVQVGLGQFVPAHIPKMLEARDRKSAGSTAPAHGLFLQWIQFADPSVEVPPSPETADDRLDSEHTSV